MSEGETGPVAATDVVVPEGQGRDIVKLLPAASRQTYRICAQSGEDAMQHSAAANRGAKADVMDEREKRSRDITGVAAGA